MKRFTCFVLALEYDAFIISARKIRRSYINSVFAWIAVTIMGFISGFDIAHNFTDNPVYLTAAGSISMFLIGFLDYLLISNHNNHWLGTLFRVMITVIVATIASVSALGLLFDTDIQNHYVSENNTDAALIDSTYLLERRERYQKVYELEAEQARYHKEICDPEARYIRAGARYERKHRHCQQLISQKNEEEARLDALEVPFYNAYLNKKENTNLSISLTDRYTILFKLASEDLIKSTLVIVIFLFLLLFDLSAILSKFSIPKNNDYTKHEKDLLDRRQEATKIKIKVATIENMGVTIAMLIEKTLQNANLLKHLQKLTFTEPFLKSIMQGAMDTLLKTLDNPEVKTVDQKYYLNDSNGIDQGAADNHSNQDEP